MAELSGVTGKQFLSELYQPQQPLVMRGLAADWPAVKAANASGRLAADYLLDLAGDRAVETLHGPAEREGLFFYSDDIQSLNFERRNTPISKAFEAMLDEGANGTTYIQSVPTPDIVPGFAEANPSNILSPKIVPRIWIGNRLSVQTHFDMSQNIAVVVSGRRRFTLFPPDQTPNLYMGPMEFTPAGTPISLVRLDDIDRDRFPNFAKAEAVAQSAILEPGDAIFIPYLWWHHVQSLDRFNVLVNYWWNEYDALGSPMDAMLHGILAFRDMPAPMRAAWQTMFETYVFGDGDAAAAHIPDAVKGGLGRIDPLLRATLWQSLAAGAARTARRFTGR
jgi:hypothetical protein